MLQRKSIWLAGVAIILPTSAAYADPSKTAAEAAAPQPVAAPQQSSDAAPAQAGVSAADATPSTDDPTGAQDIVVFGNRETRQTQTLTARDLAVQVPGASPLQALSKLPSVKFTSADALGNYEWSVRIAIRGFNQDQLGYTLDDVPLGDMSYGNYNGLHISRAITQENIGTTTLAQGAAALDTASSSNIGGAIMFKSFDPSHTLGADVSGTYGSGNDTRLFARLNTGDLPGGGRGYVSYVFQQQDKWKGYGDQTLNQVNAKYVQPIGASAELSAFLNFSDRKENDYQDLSLDSIRRLGLKLDNITDNYPLALAIATAYQNGDPIPAPYGTVDDAYFNAAGLRQDWLTGATFKGDLIDRLSFRLTGYYHHDKGQGQWWTPYQASPNGVPISARVTNYRIHRGGLTGSLSYELFDGNKLEVGGWHEYDRLNLSRDFYQIDGTRHTLTDLHYFKNPFRTQFDDEYRISTWMFFVLDEWQITDQLKVNGGFKSLDVRNKSTSGAIDPPDSQINGTITAKDHFLPQVGALYEVGNWGELFGTYAENMRAFTIGAFSTDQATFEYIKDTIEPERTRTIEGGVRAHTGSFQGVLAAYHVKFSNRLLSAANGPPILGGRSILANVGSVTSYGIEATGTYNFTRAFSLFGSYSYNRAKYDSDVVNNTSQEVLQQTKGAQLTDTPKHQGTLQLDYDDKQLFGMFQGQYMSKRRFTLSNVPDLSDPDNPRYPQYVKGRVLFNASLGYRFPTGGPLGGIEVQGNVFNVFNKRYIATLGSNGFPLLGDYQTLLAGAPRQAFVTVRAHF